jgi:hypothetical protein
VGDSQLVRLVKRVRPFTVRRRFVYDVLVAGDQVRPGVETVDAVVRLSRKSYADDDEFAQALMVLGLSEDEAERATAFVPIAFAHFVLSRFDIVLPDTYEIWNPGSDRRARGTFRDEPIFVAAYEYAQTRGCTEDVKRIAARSAEIQTVNELAGNRDGETFDGDSVAGIVLISPILMRVPIPPPQARWWRRKKS